jgi:hypothetical protein
MKKAIIAISLSLICALFFAQPAPTVPEGTLVKAGFGTGREYLKMTKAEKWAYAMGAVNGMHNASMFGAPENHTKWFDDFLAGMSNEQVAAIITKFLNDNPERWHEPLNILTYNAIEHAYNKGHSLGER